jgi:membrane protease YdiL (CAAX protease family)
MEISSVSSAGAPAHQRHAFSTQYGREPWVGIARKFGWPVALVLVLAGMAFLVGLGYGTIAVLSALLLVLSVPLMAWLPHRLPPLNHLGTRNLVTVESEIKMLVGFALVYPVLLVPVLVAARAIPGSLIPGVTTPALSPLYLVVGKILLLGLPTLVFAARLGQLGRQLGLRRINTTWRWLGPVIPMAFVLIALGVISAHSGPPASVLPYLLVLPLAVIAIAFPEESFYRILVQTRLELLLGSRSGIALSSLLFGLMQVPVRFAFLVSTVAPNPMKALLLSVATALGYQVVLGVLYGYMWMRYRNAWVNFAGRSAVETVTLAALILP